jgi:hypothetical protein
MIKILVINASYEDGAAAGGPAVSSITSSDAQPMCVYNI